MKEYNTGLATTIWNPGRIKLLVVLTILTVLATLFMDDVFSFLPYVNLLPILFGTCVGGPVYGTVIAIITFVFNFLTGAEPIIIVYAIEAISLSIFFGAYVRLGFFATIQGVWVGVVACTLMDTLFKIPIHFAFNGGHLPFDTKLLYLHNLLERFGERTLFISVICFLVVTFIDMAIFLFIVYFLIKKLPSSVMEFFSIPREFPTMQVVKDEKEEEFLSETDKLKAKAMEKIEKAKEAAGEGQADEKKDI
ncbi:hypothetical protein M2145_000968 [Lachnospiraceae bacterium PF1-21]|uniref:hypothetical protein n=1 Tax=Ohessyouella blattaphilus TaxID=2949333 RepID=UPI003E23AE90